MVASGKVAVCVVIGRQSEVSGSNKSGTGHKVEFVENSFEPIDRQFKCYWHYVDARCRVVFLCDGGLDKTPGVTFSKC